MKPGSLLRFVVVLLCLAGAYYCWRLGDRWAGKPAAGEPAGAGAAAGLGRGVAATSVAPTTILRNESSAPFALLSQPRSNAVAGVKRDPFPYRLSNTKRSVGELVREEHAI